MEPAPLAQSAGDDPLLWLLVMLGPTILAADAPHFLRGPASTGGRIFSRRSVSPYLALVAPANVGRRAAGWRFCCSAACSGRSMIIEPIAAIRRWPMHLKRRPRSLLPNCSRSQPLRMSILTIVCGPAGHPWSFSSGERSGVKRYLSADDLPEKESEPVGRFRLAV